MHYIGRNAIFFLLHKYIKIFYILFDLSIYKSISMVYDVFNNKELQKFKFELIADEAVATLIKEEAVTL